MNTGDFFTKEFYKGKFSVGELHEEGFSAEEYF